MLNESKLIGRIAEKYGNRTNFAKVIHSSTASVSAKLKGNRQMNVEEVKLWCDKLEISPYEIGDYFFN